MSRVFKLKASDGEIFEVDQSVAEQFEMVKRLMEDNDDETEVEFTEIPLTNVESGTLAKVIEWCKERTGTKTAEELKEWDKEFVAVDTDLLYDLLMAANYLEIKVLLDQVCERAADLIRGKTPEEIRKTFGIENDFTPEEEEKLRKENAWAFD